MYSSAFLTSLNDENRNTNFVFVSRPVVDSKISKILKKIDSKKVSQAEKGMYRIGQDPSTHNEKA